MDSRQKVALLLLGLIAGSSCQNMTSPANKELMEVYQELVNVVVRRQAQKAVEEVAQERAQEMAEGRAKSPESRTKHHIAIFIKQILPLISTAIANALGVIILNWFYPLKVNPTIPGKVDFTRIWTAPLPAFGRKR